MKYAAVEDQKVQDFIEIQLKLIGQIIEKMIPGIVSIVLSGSFSRGEGSIQVLNEQDFIIQKDFDIFIFSREIPDQLTYKTLKDRVLKEIKTSNNVHYGNKNFKINLEFIDVNHINDLPPDISTYELKKNGLIISGKNILHLIPKSVSKFNTSTILRILLNKLIGLVENNPFFNENSLDISYECHKTYIEINTVLCILFNCYETNYTARFNALKQNWEKVPKYLRDLEPDLLNKMEEALNFKLKPIRNLEKINLKELWLKTKDLLTDLLVVLASSFISNPHKMDSDDNLIIYLKKFYYFPYSQRVLNRFKIKSQFLNHLISKAYIILEETKDLTLSPTNKIINLYLSSYFLLKAIDANGQIDENYFNEAKKYIQEKNGIKVNLKNWKLLSQKIISLKKILDSKKIKKKSSRLF